MEGTKSNPPNLSTGGVISPPFHSLPSKAKVPGGGGDGNGKRKLPNPKEMVEHYESLGMDKEAASLQAIEDLQNVIFRVVSSSSTKNKSVGVDRRMAQLEMKLDSKPGYAQSLLIGVAAGGITTALANIWESVRRTSNPNP